MMYFIDCIPDRFKMSDCKQREEQSMKRDEAGPPHTQYVTPPIQYTQQSEVT